VKQRVYNAYAEKRLDRLVVSRFSVVLAERARLVVLPAWLHRLRLQRRERRTY
jgi:hypothetical protein